MIRPINHDQLTLAQKSEPATKADAAVITDLRDTLQAHHDECVGMAANMIGVNKDIIIVQMGMLAIPMVNPKITQKSGPYTTQEGCLSLAGQRSAKRYKTITVQYLDSNFTPQTQTFTEWIAQIIQHEMDHLQGILI
ncbi:peptide deformylase [Lactobacillus selangorensis]|uniref:Peptide deformylase n=1 Tax=Lactobacillus selangorensis TaxID=81857 RepID=A0A0R2FX85_9LACO|nr:peptide deformylase [Lactobacillus selangorensis]KRN28814.1 peptide deformylase [Lactobacillus selangorensis]KRN32776.1 peptide deformylase [Lactobacillus selangorensis]